MRIILGSKSPRRKELLSKIGVKYECIVSNEEEIITKDFPGEVVIELSKRKALAVEKIIINNSETTEKEDVLIICADTVVAAENKILGKPEDEKQAYEMISMIQGNVHQVFTGVTLIYLNKEKNERRLHSFYESTDVFVKDLSEDEIKWYISTGEPFDKAGGYGIQGFFGVNVTKIEGDYNNVVGLPISRLYTETLKELGINLVLGNKN